MTQSRGGDGAARPPKGRLVRGSLQFNILIIFISLLVAMTVSVAWYTYQKQSEAILDLSEDIIHQVSATAIEKTVRYLEPLRQAAETTAAVAGRAAFLDRRPELVAYLVRTLAVHDHFYSLYVGYADGDFLQVITLPEGLQRFRPDDMAVPPGAVRVVRLLDRDGEDAVETWTYVDADGRTLAVGESSEVVFDPRVRPWYQGAEQSDGAFWSDLYVFFSLGKPGLTASSPVRGAAGGIEGVVGADVALDALSAFLAGQHIGQSGAAFIINSRDELVAFPDPARVVATDGGRPRPVVIDELGEAGLSAAVAARREGGAARAIVEADGISFISAFTAFPPSFGKDWTIGVVVPVDDFVGTVKETNQTSLAISLVVLLVGIVVIVVVSRWISRPIRNLAGEARKIRDLDLDGTIEVPSHVAEVRELAESMGAMKTAVQALGKFVPKGLVQELMDSGVEIELGGRNRELTVMFTDIDGFATISEHMAPEALMLQVSDYFEELTVVLRDHRATIDKYIGDSIMAFWGAPAANLDHAGDACMAVLFADRRTQALNAQWRGTGKPSFVTRFGLHCGETVVGTLGSSERMSYTVLGDTVNLAYRLEGLNKTYGTRICVSQDIHGRVEDRFLLRPLDIVAVKGRQQGTFVYELLGAREGDPDVVARAPDYRRCRMTEEGIDAYLGRRWGKAIAVFTDLADAFPDDGLPGVYLPRLNAYRTHPPPDDWRGI